MAAVEVGAMVGLLWWRIQSLRKRKMRNGRDERIEKQKEEKQNKTFSQSNNNKKICFQLKVSNIKIFKKKKSSII